MPNLPSSAEPQTANSPLYFDVVIVGGGVAGLWLLNRLCNAGYHCILLEANSLGSGQSVASQGMIHGGVKYTLSASLTGASEAIADMPDYWRRCLRGEGDVDLRDTRSLSDHFYMWSTASSLSKVTAFFASKALRGRVNKLKPAQYPAAFQGANNTAKFKGQVYALLDTVIDAPSLLQNLADNHQQRLFKINADSLDWLTRDNTLELHINNSTSIQAKQFFFSAGEGNQALLEAVNASAPAMQIRPLQQVLVKHNNDISLYAHCIGRDSTPRLTISSHPCADGSMCWYLGGQLSEQGSQQSAEQVIQQAQQEIQTLFPWLNWHNSQWHSLPVNRAEPRQKNFARPEQAYLAAAKNAQQQNFNNLAVAWPTKLTLAPHLGDEALRFLQQQAIQPAAINEQLKQQQAADLQQLAQTLPRPQVATPPWDALQSGWQTLTAQ